jgi:hypothetical protein
MTTKKRTRQPVRVAKAAMALVDWEEKLKVAARAFVAHEGYLTWRRALRIASCGTPHWRNELEKVKEREARS